MKKHIVPITLLIALPIITFLVIDYATKGNFEQVTIICAYMAFVFMLVNIDIEYFIYISSLKEYWTTESPKDITFHLPDSSYTNNTLTTKPERLFSHKPIDALSKVKCYTTDSNVFVKSLRDNLIWILFANVFVLFLTYILNEKAVPVVIPDSKTAIDPHPAEISSIIKSSLGYLAVMLQTAFFISQLYLHRNRNNRLNAELSALK